MARSARFEPGDDICPPWPWWKHWPRPRPPWWNERLEHVGEEIFAGLSVINMAGKVEDAQLSLAVAHAGLERITKHVQELQGLLQQTKG